MARSNDPERNFLRLYRIIAIIVATILIIFTVVIDDLGRLLYNPSFHVSEFIFGGLVTSWLILLGFEGVSVARDAVGKVTEKLKDDTNGS